MPKFPDEITIEPNATIQNWMNGIGFVIGLCAVGAFMNGDGGAGLFCVLITSVLWWIASKIPTTKKFRGGGAYYE